MSYEWSLSLRFTHRNPLCIPIALHTSHKPSPISSICVWPPEQNLLWNTNHEASLYLFFSSLLYFLSAAPQCLPQIPSVCFLFLTWETKFSTQNTYTHILGCIICRCSSFRLDICTENRDTKNSHSVFVFVSRRFPYLSNYTNKTHNIYSLRIFTLFLLHVSVNHTHTSSGRT